MKERDFEAGRQEGEPGKNFDCSQRAQWLRAVVLGGNEGLVSATLLMMGAGTHIHETKILIITGLLGLLAGALSIATAEFVSVYAQVDIVKAQNNRDQREGRVGEKTAAAPSPTQIAVAASVAYLVGGILPLLAAFAIKDQKIRVIVAAATSCFSMLVLGNVAAALGKASVARSCARVLVGGSIEIAVMVGRRKVLEVYGS
ncbi:hypothetical protein RJ639_033825 [Escallonia herrerae]|uniref:Vacuolar iron transporter n=1 Tax=Escallonia herrerae TaxID=1293975 RepID=A0AA88WX53_9ASTE|nr:hypothetical protein RJ639_033825 [Escallonia herrerae]